MKQIYLFILILAILVPLQATQIFYENFESASASSYWGANKIVDYNSYCSYFLGRYSNDTVTLTITGLPANSLIQLNFDLYIIDSWDANASGHNDHFRILANGTVLRDDLFGNFESVAALQTYTPRPGDVVRQDLGFMQSSWLDSKYYNYNDGFVFVNPTSTLTITFEGYGLQGAADESWGIDNVSVTTLPEPGTFGLLILSVALFSFWKGKK